MPLAACWSLEKLNHSIYGKNVRLETDHKPLDRASGERVSQAHHLLLRMAKYDVDRRYIPDRTNVVADAMSRVSHMEPASQGHKLPVIEVGTITSTLPATPEKFDEIRNETSRDETLCHLKDVVYHG